MIFNLFDVVRLSHNSDEYGLSVEGIGTIVEILDEEEGVYEVEFDGDSLRTVTLKHSDINRIE